MSTQQDIYAAGSKNRPPMLNKENYIPWSSRLLRYAKSRPNRKLIYNSIMNGPYVRRMIPEPRDADHEVPVEADDQAIQTILLGLPKYIYVVVDRCETAQEIWLRVQQMMKGSDIGIQENKAKLFNEWERFTSTDGESIESYYHHCSTENEYGSRQIDDAKVVEAISREISLEKCCGQNVGNKMGNAYRISGIRLFRMQYRIQVFSNGLMLFWGSNQNPKGMISADCPQKEEEEFNSSEEFN
ncbi:hypothetical protein Tco_1124933 [Tanacetum coccineum]|uniref:Uncharacterized protein n=1 Tax=Tanacetum coccineum TaxID=301880 RepID=A0ABQ5JAE7_9ASTR